MLNRRNFLKSSVATVATSVSFPYILKGQGSPNEKLNIAFIGLGTMGGSHVKRLTRKRKLKDRINVVAFCDPDESGKGLAPATKIFEKFPDVKRFKDYRKMFDKMEKDIDAIVISTPDHIHFPAAMLAVQAKKHIYLEKPMCHSIDQIRKLTIACKNANIATQMGNQGHSDPSVYRVKDWCDTGVIGDVKKVDITLNNINFSAINKPTVSAIPKGLDWDLWLGNVKNIDFSFDYLQFQPNWRGFDYFGSGIIGDWGCHQLDLPYYALNLGYPESVMAEISSSWAIPNSYPSGAKVTYQFPQRGKLPPVELVVYIGDKEIEMPRPQALEESRRFSMRNVIYGDKNTLTYGPWGQGARLIPEIKMKEITPKRIKTPDHYTSWLDMCKGGKAASSNFEYAGPLTEVVLLADIAIHCPNKKLLWDAKNMKFTNSPEANKLLKSR